MTLPCLGRVRGTHTTTRASPSASSTLSWMVCSSLAPASVSLATTRMVFMGFAFLLVRWVGRSPGGRRRLARHRLGRRSEYPVDGTGHAILVGAADDGGDLVEVEDRRRRGDLPPERERPPRVPRGARPAAPGGGHVV